MSDGKESEDVNQLLEEESAEEEHFRLAHQNSSHLQPGASIGLVHSPTTDTLDSVYLDAPISDSELTESSEIKLDEKEEKIIEEKVEDSTDNMNKVDTNIQSLGVDENPIKVEASSTTLQPETVDINLDGISINLDKDELDDLEIKSSHEIKGDSQPSLTKYFGSANINDEDADDFFSSLPPVDSEKGELATELTENDVGDMDDLLDLIIDDAEPKDDTSKEADNEEEAKVSRLSQLEPQPSAESVPFEMTEDVEEKSLPVEIEDDKEDFESFTAETMDTETMDALGMSPAATSFMTERNIQDYFRQGSQADSVRSLGLDRQLSSSSGTSTKTGLSQEPNVFPTSLEDPGNTPNVPGPELPANESQPPTPAHKVSSESEVKQEVLSDASGAVQAATVPTFASPAHVPVLRQRKDSQKSESGKALIHKDVHFLCFCL